MDAFKSPQLMEGFLVHNTDTASDTKYYGYVNTRGAWYIMKEVTSTGTFTYTKGTSAYATGWTNRATLTYAALNTAFAT